MPKILQLLSNELTMVNLIIYCTSEALIIPSYVFVSCKLGKLITSRKSLSKQFCQAAEL